MTNTSEGIAPVPARLAGRPGRAVLALAAIAVGLGACEGDNLYTGEGPSFDPRVLEISAPDFVFAGDTVTVLVRAAAAREVEQIVVSARGAANVDTVVEVDEPKQQIAQVVKIAIPDLVTDTLLRITASIIDAVGAQSAPRQLLVTAAGPPVIQTVGGPTGVRPGDLISLRVRAFGTRPIGRLDIAARGAINRDTTVAVSPARASVEQDVAFRIPASVQDTLITFSVTAQDESGLTSAPRTTLVPFAIDTPSISMIVPSSVEAGKVLNIGLRAHSLRQVTEVRIELRGGVIQDLVFPMSPARATTIEYIAVQLPEDLIVPQLRVRAFALDRGMTLSATDVETVVVPSGVPVIQSVDLYASTVLAGHFVDARVTATGDRPIRQIRFRWRGFTAQTLIPLEENEAELSLGPDQVVDITPPNVLVVQDAAVETPCVRGGGTFLLLVTAYDQDDRLSAISTRTATVAGNPLCQNPVDVLPDVDDEEPGPRAPGIIRSGIGRSR